MGRRKQITKEMMLEAAYDILESKGYSAVNIQAIATKVGCSTQPISWQFGNMLGLRKELYQYAEMRLTRDLDNQLSNLNALEALYEAGKIHISCALEKPSVFRFVYVDDPSEIFSVNLDMKDRIGNPIIKERLVDELGLSREIIDKVIADIIIYTHGLSVLILWESMKIDKEKAFEMILEHANLCFKQFGIDLFERLGIK